MSNRVLLGVVVLVAACSRQPPRLNPMVAAASVIGDSSLALMVAAPRGASWTDDIMLRTSPESYVLIFEYSKAGKPQMRSSRGGEVRTASSVYWEDGKRQLPPGRVPRYAGAAAGTRTCGPGYVQTGQDQGYVSPLSCADHPAPPRYAPSSQTGDPRVKFRPVLVVVADSAFHVAEADTWLREFVAASGDKQRLEQLAHSLAPAGRWFAASHLPN